MPDMKFKKSSGTRSRSPRATQWSAAPAWPAFPPTSPPSGRAFASSPAISIPAGLHEGLPIGVQLVGQFGQEYDLLDFAEQLEKMPGFGFQRPPEMEMVG